MNKTPSSEPESPEPLVYEKPALVEYGTLLDLTLSGTNPNPEHAIVNPGGSAGST